MTLHVDIWSDVACPWCYIGKARFLRGLADFEHRDEVTVRFRAFELDPTHPRDEHEPVLAHLAAKYGVTIERAEGMEARVRAAAHDEDLPFGGDRLYGNTFDIHRLLHFAATQDRQLALLDAVFTTHFGGTGDVFDRDVLLRLATDAGLDRDAAASVLDGDAFTEEVRADEELAARLGATGVPFFVVDGRYGVSGAQAPESFTQVLQRAWDERAAQPA